MIGKNEISDYLARNTILAAEQYAAGKPWTRVIWDVTAVAWLLNESESFMRDVLVKTQLPEYDGIYSVDEQEKVMKYVYNINRDELMHDLLEKLTK